MLPIAGLLVSFAAAWLLARSWSLRGETDVGKTVSNVAALVLLVVAFALWIAVFGALRGTFVALFATGGAVLPAALLLELRRGSASKSAALDD